MIFAFSADAAANYEVRAQRLVLLPYVGQA